MSGHSVRPAATFLGQRLDETLLFKSFDGPVERARLEAHTSKGLDVLCQRVTVLRPAREGPTRSELRDRRSARDRLKSYP